MLSNKAKEIFSRYEVKMKNGDAIHRYELEAEFEAYSKRYKDSQKVELLLKGAFKENSNYKQLFEKLYGDMPKYGGGGFSLWFELKLYVKDAAL